MAELPRTTSAELPAIDAGRWIGRVLIAVILGEGIWGLIVSLTNNLILPLLARVMGADAQSPLYLGKGDVNFPALFISLLELCFAAIIAVILNSWVRRKPRLARSKAVRVGPIPQAAVATPAPRAVVPVQVATPVQPPAKAPTPAPVATAPTAPSGQFWSPPEPSSQPKSVAPAPPAAKPAKSKKPKEVYYNLVGEPITPDDDE